MHAGFVVPRGEGLLSVDTVIVDEAALQGTKMPSTVKSKRV
jgi:hypothetical protein